MLDEVFLLYHTHIKPDDEEDYKLIGVYRTEKAAEEAIKRTINLPGFKDAPDGFEICRYEIGKDNWTEGYVTV